MFRETSALVGMKGGVGEGWRKIVVMGFISLAMSACGVASTSGSPTAQGTEGSAGLAQHSAQDIALQTSDVTGLSRCSQSGSPDGVVQALRSSGYTQGADRLARSWQDAKANGARDGYVVAYLASANDCPRIFGVYGDSYTPQGNWVFSYVVVFSNASQAQAAWKAGIYFPTPPESELKLVGGAWGQSTGLSDNAFTEPLIGGGWMAAWSKGSSFSVLVTNYGPLTTSQLAGKVAARM